MNQLTARQQLRRRLRSKRKAIPLRQRRACAQQLAQRLDRLTPLRHARHVAAYNAVGSEISLQAWIARQHHRRVYLPRLRSVQMDFVPASTQLQHNRHGIAEPRAGRPRPLWACSVILIPLLGFDPQGNRLGQGGGYYDRALARLRWRRPWLLGIAYDEQQCDAIPTQAWDQPLDGVITPTQTLLFRT